MSFLFRSSLIAAVATVATAQTLPLEHDSIALDNVLVTAHPYARAQSDLAQATSLLTGHALALRQAGSIGELLAAEPGISSTWFGPGASRPIIRGLGGDRLRILQNSLGTSDASVTSPDHAVALDLLLIERVEIVRGPASLLYGSSAVGGVVNVITHRIHQTAPEAPLEGRIEARGGAVDDERSGGLVLEGGVGQFAWHLDAYRRTSNDVDIPGFANSARLRALEDEEAAEHGEAPPAHAYGHIPNTAVEADGAAAGGSWIGARGYIGIAFSGHNSLYGVPPGGHAHEGEEHEDEDHEEDAHEHGEDEAHAEAEYVWIDLRQRRLELEGEHRFDGGVLRALRAKISRSEYRHQELEDDVIGTVFTNKASEARIEALHDPVGRFTGAAGVQLNRTRFAAVGDEAFLPPTRTTQQAVFLFEEAEFSPLTWQFGIRGERQEIAVRDASGRRRDDHGLSASTGLVWDLGAGWSVATSLTRTVRPPNAQELYADGPHLGTQAYEVGDPTLSRERSLGLDLALRRTNGRVTGGVTVFLNRFDGYIFESPTGEEADGLEVYEYVQRDARFTGAELETIFHVYHSEQSLLDVTLAADLVRARDTDLDQNLPRITPPRIRLGLDWHSGAWAAGFEIQRVLAQSHVAANESSTDGYTLVSASISRTFVVGRSTFEVLLRGTNLADEEARVHTSFLKEVAPLPGRNVMLALRASF